MKRQPVSVRLLWRRFLVADLSLFNAGVFALAYLPPATLNYIEVVCMAGSAAAILGLVSHLCHNRIVPGDQWAYLLTAWVGGITLSAYVLFAKEPVTYEIAVPVFLAGGIASAAAAHIIDGGKPRTPTGDG